MSSRSFLGTVVFPEQVCLEPFLKGGETVSVSDGGGELIPPLSLSVLLSLFLFLSLSLSLSLYIHVSLSFALSSNPSPHWNCKLFGGGLLKRVFMKGGQVQV